MAAPFTPLHRGGSGSPMVCLHGFTDSWRTWELVLPALEREHDVLAVTLAGHAGTCPQRRRAGARRRLGAGGPAIRRVGHCPQLDVPGPTAELVLAFADRAGD